MNHHATTDFWEHYRKLPGSVRTTADKQFQRLKDNPSHPSLRVKKVGRFWSVRIGRGYRALAVARGEDLVWFWIGSHADYDRLIGQ